MRAALKFSALVLFVALAFVLARSFGLGALLEGGGLEALLEELGPWAPAAYILLYAVAACLMFPGLPVTVLGGVLFGPVWGSVFVAIGATTGAALAFLLARGLGSEFMEGLLGEGRLMELYRKTEEQGWKIVAFARLVPIFPYNVLNYAFGLTKIGFAPYVAASFVFMLPGIVAYVVFSSSLLGLVRGEVGPAFFIGLGLIVLITLVAILVRRSASAGRYWRR